VLAPCQRSVSAPSHDRTDPCATRSERACGEIEVRPRRGRRLSFGAAWACSAPRLIRPSLLMSMWSSSAGMGTGKLGPDRSPASAARGPLAVRSLTPAACGLRQQPPRTPRDQRAAPNPFGAELGVAMQIYVVTASACELNRTKPGSEQSRRACRVLCGQGLRLRTRSPHS
jgi:hypothetical protein